MKKMFFAIALFSSINAFAASPLIGYSEVQVFDFAYDNAFVSTDSVKAEMEKEADVLNKTILNIRNINMSINSVTRDWNSQIHGQLEGKGCLISSDYFVKVNISELRGVSRILLEGAGFVFADKNSLLIPVCMVANR